MEINKQNVNVTFVEKITMSVNYIIEHYEKFLLLLFAFAIIYLVDYISNINALIYGAIQIPGITTQSTTNKPQNKQKQNKQLQNKQKQPKNK